MKILTTPLTIAQVKGLSVGDEARLSGVIYTVRDQAHKRLIEAIKKGIKLPFVLKGQIFYYCGPTGTPEGRVIGSCGPTTSSRMDMFTPFLLSNGLSGMIGKGRRSHEVVSAIKKYNSVYFLAPAGCGAYLTKFVKKADEVTYSDLGPEAILKLEVKDFPLIVGVDSSGRSIYV